MSLSLSVADLTLPKIAYVVEPRFSGGTSSAVAQELRVAAQFGQLSVHAVTSKTFGKKQLVAPSLRRVLDELHIPLIWDAPRISADFVVLHNPSFLKFQDELPTKIFARELIVVTHENFLRPGGEEGFDVANCLNQIEAASLALKKTLAPISGHNRKTVTDWLDRSCAAKHWQVLKVDWFNICDFELTEPSNQPSDRRGRHSRPGFEKFPTLIDLDHCFSPQAQENVILGADSLLEAGFQRPHWTLLPFDAISVSDFFEMIDFYVYFTAPTWQESFGRVIAEAIAAGKVVLTDANTGQAFGDAVVKCKPGEVDEIVARFVAQPDSYQNQVRKAQQMMAEYSSQKFEAMISGVLSSRSEVQP
ncbi:hypothetical protein [Ruegeria sp. HKCCD7255]|uniref:hypothetical protein n=1 Tax=Ruegeria sp. HKCCD7255 TaxID=2683004 RepID=UPI001487A333|nr:hypothetical protein [Ruegeria sp. HKCCD7255]